MHKKLQICNLSNLAMMYIFHKRGLGISSERWNLYIVPLLARIWTACTEFLDSVQALFSSFTSLVLCYNGSSSVKGNIICFCQQTKDFFDCIGFCYWRRRRVWDFSGNGYWSGIVDVYKVTLTLKHISEYGEVEVEDIRELSDRLVHNGILVKTGVTTYRVITEHECDFCCRIDISQ